jgi:DNA polymerase-3 subunit delta'
MSEDNTIGEGIVRHPRETDILVGHGAAEDALLDAYRSGRIAHAWLIGGMQGIGKATLAFRMARFVLAHPDPESQAVQGARDLSVDAGDPVARQIATRAHGGLLVLERKPNEKGVLRQVIRVDEVRETVSFFGSTAATDGWRVCIVDCMDELNLNGANALLKILEEPPPRSLFLLVSHAPSRLLPTIHSRCRKLPLKPLTNDEVVIALSEASRGALTGDAIGQAAALADGSVQRALSLLDTRAARMSQRVAALLGQLPRVDAMELHAVGDTLPLNDKAALAAFIGGVERWIESRVGEVVAGPAPDLPRLARLAEVWEKIGRAARETADYNLERKPLVFSVVNMLAEAVA